MLNLPKSYSFMKQLLTLTSILKPLSVILLSIERFTDEK